MRWWERNVHVANGIAVRVRAAEPSWLELLPPAVADAASPAAVLHVQRGQAVAEATGTEIAYKAELRWASSERARFSVPGGQGELSLATSAADVHLQLAAGNEELALGTTLRMLLGLLLPAYGGLLVHASAVALGGRVHVFLGASGAGKTTTARRLAGEGATLLAEDLLVLKTSGGVCAEACRFDYSFAKACPEAASLPIAAAYLVYKGAASTEVCAPRSTALQAWSSAIFSPLVGSGFSSAFLEVLGAVQRIPLRGLSAAPDGPLRPAIEGVVEGECDEPR
jgi:hypothetical protein